MKLARRRPADVTDPSVDLPTQSPSPRPTPPRGAPVATFAGVLDGRTLWLAIAAAPGRLGLRDTATGDVVSPAGDLAEDQPEHRSLRLDLDDLGGADEAGEASYDVVLVDQGGRAPRAVWSPPLPPARVAAHDGHRWEVRRSDDGLLGLRRTAVAPAVELVAISADPEGLRLVVDPAAPLVLRHDPAEGTAEGTADDDAGGEPRATDVPLPDSMLTVAALDGVGDRATRVTTADGRPVVRRDNDLLNPGRGAPLPELYLPGDGVRDPLGLVRVRLRWADDGVLLARVLGPEASA